MRRIILCVLLSVGSGCAATLHLTNGERIVGEIRGGYESTVSIDGEQIPRSMIGHVSHPKSAIVIGVLTVLAGSAMMLALTPNHQRGANFWAWQNNGWLMNYGFLVGMSCGSSMLYLGLTEYDRSVAMFDERRPDPIPRAGSPSRFVDRREDDFFE